MILFGKSDESSDFSDKPKEILISKPILPNEIDSDIVERRESDGMPGEHTMNDHN